MNRSTIAAICTPHGFGGVGIVKVSGSQAEKIARSIFRKRNGRVETGTLSSLPKNYSFEANRIGYGVIVAPGDGRKIDEVLLSFMRGPHTYTGEDVIEINAHGGPVVLNAILETVLEQGAVLAQPGEFTCRAFLNGRIDLTQAEAVADLINAKTTAAAHLAQAQLSGQMRLEIEKISSKLRQAIVKNEVAIDFSEDVETEDELVTDAALFKKDVIEPLQHLIKQYQGGKILREGLRLAIIGRPNVGKSSLMNRLGNSEKVIVTSIPGTTRDAVEDYIKICGLPVVLVDTAGLQQTENPVEIIGIRKTRENIENADAILFLVEAGTGVLPEDLEIFQQIRGKQSLIILNKIDLEVPGRFTRIPGVWPGEKVVRISALTGEGLDDLETEIYNMATGGGVLMGSGEFAPNLRQKNLIHKSLSAARAAAAGLEDGAPGELTALDLGEALSALDEILGIGLKEDLLGRIFSDFCIGK